MVLNLYEKVYDKNASILKVSYLYCSNFDAAILQAVPVLGWMPKLVSYHLNEILVVKNRDRRPGRVGSARFIADNDYAVNKNKQTPYAIQKKT